MDFKRNFGFEIHLKIYDFVTLENVWNSINVNIFLELIVKMFDFRWNSENESNAFNINKTLTTFKHINQIC